MNFQRQFFYIYPVGLLGCLIAGVLNGIGSIFYYTALSRLDASVGHLIYSFYPLFVALWLWLDRQQISRITLLRLTLALPGILSADSHRARSRQSERGIHDVARSPFLCPSSHYQSTHFIRSPCSYSYALHFAGYGINRGRSICHCPPGASGLFAFMVACARDGRSHVPLTSDSFPRRQKPGRTANGLLGLSELLVTVFLAQVWLGERLSPAQWAGAFLIGGSMLLMALDQSSPNSEPVAGGYAGLIHPSSRD